MNYSTDVMEVHNEFMTAGDALLKKAEQILKTEVKINPAKIARLEAFGFKSSKDATALQDDKKEKTHQYKGFVPEKNLNEIEKFFEAHPDMRYTYTKTVKSSGTYMWFTPDTQIEKDEYDEIMAKQPKEEKHIQSFAKGLDMEIPKAVQWGDYCRYNRPV